MKWSDLPESSRPRVILATFNCVNFVREHTEPALDPMQVECMFSAYGCIHIELFFNDARRVMLTSVAQFAEWFHNESVRTTEVKWRG